MDDADFAGQLIALGAPERTRDLVLGDLRVRVHGVTDDVATTIEHALVEPDRTHPVATVHHVTGPAPAPPWSPEDCLVRDQVRGRTSGRFRALYRPDVPSLSFADLESATGVLWHRSTDGLPARESAAPFAPLLSWLLAAHGLRMTHGAVVGHERGAVLLAGPAGAGKTTTTLACVRSGLRTTGEDYVVLDVDRHEGLAAYDAAKLGDFALDRFPEARPHVRGTSEQGKAVVALTDVFPGSLAARLPLRAIVVPRVSARTGSRPVPLPAAVALRALSAGSLVQLAGDDARMLAQLAALTRALPSFVLDVGPDLEAIAPALEPLLSGRTEAA